MKPAKALYVGRPRLTDHIDNCTGNCAWPQV
jgi:hypothetical protein